LASYSSTAEQGGASGNGRGQISSSVAPDFWTVNLMRWWSLSIFTSRIGTLGDDLSLEPPSSFGLNETSKGSVLRTAKLRTGTELGAICKWHGGLTAIVTVRSTRRQPSAESSDNSTAFGLPKMKPRTASCSSSLKGGALDLRTPKPMPSK